jgi:hypothetical protein
VADLERILIVGGGIAGLTLLTLDAAPPGYTGLMVWRSLAPYFQPGMQVLLGEGCVYGLVPMGDGQTYGFGIEGSSRFHDPLEGRLGRVRRRFAAFGGRSRRIWRRSSATSSSIARPSSGWNSSSGTRVASCSSATRLMLARP